MPSEGGVGAARFAPPARLDVLRRRLARCAFPHDLDERIGGLVRVLAASKTGGVALQLGRGTVEYASWTLDGMDILSRVIVNIPSQAPPPHGLLADDLRVAVHVQTPAQFLADIHQHRFDLLVVDVAEVGARTARVALAMLRVGAFAVLLNVDEAAVKTLRAALAGDAVVELGAAAPCLLITRRAPEAKPVRRGGSRGRRRPR